ncbi:MAG: ParB N-terminal domain-containing protein [Caulobacterales bacterium]|nr:ParB N-terminal domain-containing protein [Caulobacterales bacterium]
MTRRAHSVPVVETTSVAVAAASSRRQRIVRLRDLDVAPENLRFGEPPDADIPELAATIKAAGLLLFPTVRPGRRKEAAFMVLDGRRRLLALRLLRDAGDIDDDHPVEVFEETDRARQAAAVVLTNTAAPVHVADVVAAIGRMLNARLTVTAIAQALGYADVEIKRLAALSALPAIALEALKAGRMTLRQARLLARLKDVDEQVDLARAALDGHGFQDWRVTERLDESRVTTRDPRCALVGPDLYAAAGGRTETDLFGELPPVLLDLDLLTAAWMKRAREIAAVLEGEGLEVHVTAGPSPDLPDDLELLGYVHGGALSADEMAAWREARDRYDETVEAVESGDLGEDAVGRLLPMIRARIARDQAGVGDRAITVLVMGPSNRTGVEVRCYAPVEPEIEPAESQDGAAEFPPAADPVYAPPMAPAPEPDIEGVNHALHATRTDVATRGLIRALADDPGTALTALVARLFTALAVRGGVARTEAALAISVRPFAPTGGRVVESLDGHVRERLDARRADWEASGETVIGWVHGLAHDDRMALLAELTAITLDLREERTTLVRRSARAEAAELAALCGAEITRHWTPDAPFLQPHSRPLLLGMLAAMGDGHDGAGALKKTELVERVAEQAAARVWAPASLCWTASPDAVQAGDGPGDGGHDPASGGGEGSSGDPEGAGVFVVTPAGEAALARAAA